MLSEQVSYVLTMLHCYTESDLTANILRSKLCKTVSPGEAKSFLDTCFEAMFGFRDTSEARSFFTVKTNEEYFAKTRQLVLRVNRRASNVTSLPLEALCITTNASKKVELHSDTRSELYLDINKSSLSVVFPIDQEAVTVSIPFHEVSKTEQTKNAIRIYVVRKTLCCRSRVQVKLL